MKKLLTLLIMIMCVASAIHANDLSKDEIQSQKSAVEIVVESPMVKSTPTGVVFSVSEDKPYQFGIYSITGQLIKSIKVLPYTSTTINLPKGYYIVKCEKWAKQVVVR